MDKYSIPNVNTGKDSGHENGGHCTDRWIPKSNNRCWEEFILGSPVLNLALKSLYAATSLQRAEEGREELYTLPETNSLERDSKAKKIEAADKRIAEIKREIFQFNYNL